MSSIPVQFIASKSKSRRLRANATKRKLFSASTDTAGIQSQLAMLTATVENLRWTLCSFTNGNWCFSQNVFAESTSHWNQTSENEPPVSLPADRETVEDDSPHVPDTPLDTYFAELLEMCMSDEIAYKFAEQLQNVHFDFNDVVANDGSLPQEYAIFPEANPVIHTEADDPSSQWSTNEIRDWTRVTIHVANEAALQELDKQTCKNKGAEIILQQRSKVIRAEIIRQRWETAKANIPETLHHGLLELLLEI